MKQTYFIKEKAINSVELKITLAIDGIRVDPSACQGVGERFKEQVHGGFDLDESFHVHKKLPAEYLLPDGTLIPLKQVENTPYGIKRENGALMVVCEEQNITEIKFQERPKFYSKQTSDGIPMSMIGQHLGKHCVIVCYANYCDYFRTGDQCRFCNMNPTREVYKEEVLGAKKFYQIGETVAAAAKLGEAQVFVITGGVLSQRKEFDCYIKAMESVRKFMGKNKIRCEATAAAPTDLKLIDQIKEAGYDGLNMNLEIWDKDIFAGICPGKRKTVGWEQWVRALEYAAEVFGRGNIRSVFVTGIEPQESFLEGADYLASKGVFAFGSPWCPDPGSMMEGHRTPSPAWHLNLTKKLVDIWEKHNFTFDQFAKLGVVDILPYYDEWKNRLHHR